MLLRLPQVSRRDRFHWFIYDWGAKQIIVRPDLRRLFSITNELGDKEWGASEHHGAGAGGSSSLSFFLIQLRVSIG